ncbi:MAG: ATP-binding protein [Armatimonadetes bacterium]|nr:ATP-binding protein [Armatimonadota bacterium]
MEQQVPQLAQRLRATASPAKRGSLVARVPHLLALTAGGVLLLLGLAVLAGWYAGIPTIVQLAPTLIPMQHNTALGFLGCGAALRLAAAGRARSGAAVGGATALLGLLTLGEYLFLLDLGIDRLLVIAALTPTSLQPGRMAPNTAVCFLLGGLSLLLSGSRGGQARLAAAGVLGGAVAALGTVAAMGYVAHLPPAYGWGALTPMAGHTAVGFLVLGGGLVALAWLREGASKAGGPAWLSAAVVVGCLMTTLSLWQALVANEERLIVQAAAASGAPGSSPSHLPDLALAVGSVVSLLLGAAVHLGRAASARQHALALANARLESEVGERARVQAMLHRANEELEARVAERTVRLAAANVELQREIEERRRAQESLSQTHAQLIAAQAEKRRFFHELLRAVTRDRFHLVDAAEIPTPERLIADVPLDGAARCDRMRRLLWGTAAAEGMASQDADDLVLAAGEAAANAVKHAVGGRCQVYVEPGRLVVRVSDTGKGIHPDALPATLLVPGFSTKVSLGMGYTIMLRLMDRVWLATGPTGTVVQLEKRVRADEDPRPEPPIPPVWERL